MPHVWMFSIFTIFTNHADFFFLAEKLNKAFLFFFSLIALFLMIRSWFDILYNRNNSRNITSWIIVLIWKHAHIYFPKLAFHPCLNHPFIVLPITWNHSPAFLLNSVLRFNLSEGTIGSNQQFGFFIARICSFHMSWLLEIGLSFIVKRAS